MTTTTEQLAAVHEINQLAYRYAFAVDTRDVDMLVAAFHPDASISAFAPGADGPHALMHGHDAIARIPESMRGRFRRTAHFMTNHIVEVDGDAASGSILCTARHLASGPLGGVDLVVVLRYVDRYARRGGVWRILDREIRLLWTETHATHRDDQSSGAIAGSAGSGGAG